MTAVEKAAEKAKQEAAQGAAPADKAGQNAEQAGLDLQTISTQEPAGTLLEAQTPEWAIELLESHKAVLESNEAIIQALADFKESANEMIAQIGQSAGHVLKEANTLTEYVEADPDAIYEVAKGKEFRHPKDFNIKYSEGDNISNLPTDTLTRLLNSGLIVES